jgi:hypothetical protein
MIRFFILLVVALIGTYTSVNAQSVEYSSVNFSLEMDSWEGRISAGFEMSTLERGRALITSDIIEVPLHSERPFLAAALNWQATLADPHQVNAWIRGSSNGTDWSDWLEAGYDHHTVLDDDWYSGHLVFLDDDTRFVQFRVEVIPSMLWQYPSVRAFDLHFINPGVTPDEDLEQHKRTARRSSDTAVQLKDLSNAPQIDFQVNTSSSYDLPEYVDRVNWGAPLRLTNRASRSVTNVTHLIVHHSAGQTNSTDFAAVVRSYYSYHTGTTLGWSDIGYNWLVDGNGVIYQGRAFNNDGNTNVIGAHFAGQNSFTMGVCIIGNYNVVEPTQKAYDALRDVLAWKANERNMDVLVRRNHAVQNRNIFTISGHRDGGSTDCPGHRVYQHLPQVRNRVNAWLNPPEILAIRYAVDGDDAARNLIVADINNRRAAVIGFVMYGTDPDNLSVESTEFELPASEENQTVEIELTGLQAGQEYYYQLVVVNSDTLTVGGKLSFKAGEPTSIGDGDEQLPVGFSLEQNFPNPFNPTTTISYTLPEPGSVRLPVYNMQGQQVEILVDGQVSAGAHLLRFEASSLPSGIYMYVLEVDGIRLASRRMTLLK